MTELKVRSAGSLLGARAGTIGRVRPGDSQSLFDYTEAASGVYRGGRFIAAQLSQTSYGAALATAAGAGGMSRAMPYGDWLAPADGSSTWGR